MTARILFRILLAFHFQAAGMATEARYVLPRKWKVQILTPLGYMARDVRRRALGNWVDKWVKQFSQEIPVLESFERTGEVVGEHVNFRLPIYFRGK